MNRVKKLGELDNPLMNMSSITLSSNKIYAKMGKLIKLADDLKEVGCIGVDFSLNLPKICVLGPPSSGKSSIIESLVGFDFLPKGEDLITRRPIEIKLINNNNATKPYALFQYEEGLDGIKFEDFGKVKEKLTELIEKKTGSKTEKNITKESIRLMIHSNNNPELTLIDLPGVDESIKGSKDIAFNYIKDENSIILLVTNVNNSEYFVNNFNPASNNPLLKLVREVDKNFNRTLGVFTKIDMIPTSSRSQNDEVFVVLKRLLTQNNSEDDLKHGFFVVKNRGPNDSNITIQDFQLREREYFSSHQVLRYLSIPDRIAIESLTDKIKILFLNSPDVRRNLVLLHKNLKEKTQECQKELIKYGTDYIAYTNDTKNTYVTSLINNFCELIDRLFSGKMSETSENMTNHKLKEIYFDFLKTYKSGYNPSASIKNSEIIRIIKLTEGDRLSGFPEAEVVYSLLDGEVENLRNQVKNYVENISDITRDSIKECENKIFCRFPKLLNKIEELMNAFIDEHFNKMTHLIDSVAEMNFNYLYLDDKSLSYHELLKKFVLSDENPNSSSDSIRRHSSIHHQERSHERSENHDKDRDQYYNGLADYVKILMNYFFSIMVRNLREAIPKITGHYYINGIKTNLRFYLLTEITKEIMYENYLEEDPDVAKNRNYYINLMKTLKNCDKILQQDEDIKYAIRGDARKSIDKIIEKNITMMTKMQNQKVEDHSHGHQKTNSSTSISSSPEKSKEGYSHIRRTSDMDKKNLTGNEKRVSTLMNNNTFSSKEEYKANDGYKTTVNSYANNVKQSANNPNYQTKDSKHSIQNLLKDEDQKRQSTINNNYNTTNINSSSSNSNVQNDTKKQAEKESPITIKMDPNSSDLRDMKVNVNMDAETAYKFYQTNKKYLPTTQQVMSGAKATANFVEKNAGALNTNEEGDNSANNGENVVTGSKIQQKKNIFDPLTSLFGTGAKKDNKSSNTQSTPSNNNKKGMF